MRGSVASTLPGGHIVDRILIIRAAWVTRKQAWCGTSNVMGYMEKVLPGVPEAVYSMPENMVWRA